MSDPTAGERTAAGGRPSDPDIRGIIGGVVFKYLADEGTFLSPATIGAVEWRVWRALNEAGAFASVGAAASGARETEGTRLCTCLGTCRGAEGLGPGWTCALAGRV